MKGAATQLFKRQMKNRAFFQNYRNCYFDLRPSGKPLGITEERRPTPGATRMCESAEDGQAWD